MATYTISGIAGSFIGSGGDDSFLHKPSAADETFYGTIDGGAGVDTLRLIPADDPILMADGAMTRLFYAGAPLLGIERISFGTGLGGVFEFQTSLGSVLAGTVIEGGSGIDRLTLVGQGATIVMPDLQFVNWSAGSGEAQPDVVKLVAQYSGTRHTLQARNNFGAVQHLVAYEAFSTLNGSNGRDILQLSNSYQTLIAGDGNDDILVPPSDFGAITNALVIGGTGYDTMVVQGPVTLTQTQLRQIEAIRLDYFIVSESMPQNSSSTLYPAVLSIDTDTLGIHPIFALSGMGTVKLTMTGADFNGDALAFAAGTQIAFNIDGTAAGDTVIGTAGADTVRGGAGDDTLLGAGGDDLLYGGDGSDHLGGGAGTDKLYGGAGDDFYFVTDATDQVFEDANGGSDLITATIDYVLPANVEQLVVRSATGLKGTGNGLANTLFGDVGADTLSGLVGNDILVGKGGSDVLSGGSGADIFRYLSLLDSTAAASDRITDFAPGDRIDLTRLDANTRQAGTQPFLWIGTAAFNHVAGELRYSVTGGNAVVESDVNGDGVADFVIRLDGVTSLNPAHFQMQSVTARLYDDLGNTAGGLNGTDYLVTKGGNDLLVGRGGADILSGGSGADIFRYENSTDSLATAPDRIADFNSAEGDRIEISTTFPGDATIGGPFHWIGSSEFSHEAGELRYRVYDGDATVEGDTNGDGKADFAVILNGVTSLSASDFRLQPDGRTITGGGFLAGAAGNDQIIGSNGVDLLYGERGQDVLTGGGGADRFRYLSAGESTRYAPDHITDFSTSGQADRIEFRTFDFNTTTAAIDPFTWIGDAAFTNVAGQLRYEIVSGDAIVQADINGDAKADFMLVLEGVTSLSSSYFAIV